MSKRARRNHAPAFKTKVALAAGRVAPPSCPQHNARPPFDVRRNGMVTLCTGSLSTMDDMGTFRTIVRVAHLARPDDWRELRDVMVDPGSEYNWIPAPVLADLGITPARVERFETADGSVIERDIAFALVSAGGRATPTIVVFAGEGDLVLLGAHGLEGMNLRIDLVRRELVPAGPIPVAAAAGPAALAA